MKWTTICLVAITVSSFSCAAMESMSAPTPADQLDAARGVQLQPAELDKVDLAGGWRNEYDFVYVDAAGHICIEEQSQFTGLTWSAYLQPKQDWPVLAKTGWWSSRELVLDRVPWEEDGITRVGINGRV